jgi:2-desacetyl-2-hydroxyethyl bacteriochlorophyllide A dehydrogenase
MAPDKMRAARLHQPRKPLVIEEIETPVAGPGQVVVKMEACGICATDVHIARDGSIPTAFTPITLGHEPAGVVSDPGPEVKGWQPGDRVAIYPQITCGTCPQCRQGREAICTRTKVLGMHMDGAFADYVAVPARNMVRVPDNVSMGEAAIMTDAVATPWHAVTRRGQVRPGETVAVFGCGGLGMNAVQICRLAGAANVIAVDFSDVALERALEAGADAAVKAGGEKTYRDVMAANNGQGVDVAFEFAGVNAAIDQAVRSLRRGGRAVVVGIGPEPINVSPPFYFVYNDLTLIGSFGSDTADLAELMGLAGRGRLNLTASISSVISLDQVNQGLADLESKTGHPVRIVVAWE